MEYNNRASIIGVNLRRIENPQSGEHIFAEVVVIDKSNEILQPLLYYLHSDALEKEQSSLYHTGILPIENHGFAMAGEVMGIDKEKKMIYLRNNKTVGYKHLIVASGFKKDPSGTLHDKELAAGLYALIEALKVRKNTFEALKFPELSHLGFDRRNNRHHASLVTGKGIPASRLHQMMNHSSFLIDKSLNGSLSGTEKRLYEVVL